MMREPVMKQLRAEHFGRLLFEPHCDFTRRFKDILASPRHPGVTPAYTQVFAHLLLEADARLTALAARAGISKWSMGSLVT